MGMLPPFTDRIVIAGTILLIFCVVLGPSQSRPVAAQTALSVEGQARGETALRLQLTGSAATATEIVGREVVIRFADPISPQGVDETARNFPT